MKNTQKGSTTIVLIIIILLLIAGFGIYTYYQSQSTKNTSQTNNVEPSSVSSMTGNWQTYHGSDFSIKYPPAWTIMSNSDANGQVVLLFVGAKQTDSYTPSLKLTINRNGGTYNKGILSVANSNYFKNDNNGVVSTSTIIINGITGTKIEEVTPAVGENWQNDDFYVLFENGKAQYAIEGTFEKSDTSGSSIFKGFYNSLVIN